MQAENHNLNGGMLVTDGVFSMDGDIAPLPELEKIAQQYNLWLVVDDAHAIGVLGDKGRGSLEYCGLQAGNPGQILIGTLGKAFGSFGAFVAGSDNMIEYLIQTARSYIYTTALPPAVAGASREALRLVQSENWRRDRLGDRITRFRAGAAELGLPLSDSCTANTAIVTG